MQRVMASLPLELVLWQALDTHMILEQMPTLIVFLPRRRVIRRCGDIKRIIVWSSPSRTCHPLGGEHDILDVLALRTVHHDSVRTPHGDPQVPIDTSRQRLIIPCRR